MFLEIYIMRYLKFKTKCRNKPHINKMPWMVGVGCRLYRKNLGEFLRWFFMSGSLCWNSSMGNREEIFKYTKDIRVSFSNIPNKLFKTLQEASPRLRSICSAILAFKTFTDHLFWLNAGMILQMRKNFFLCLDFENKMVLGKL